MTSKMHELPEERTFGHQFNYAVWTAGTTIQLCNVPWGNDYRDIVRFDSQKKLDDYLRLSTGPTIIVENAAHHKTSQPVRLEIPFEAANEYNYLRVFNPTQPVNGSKPSTFYYFISDVRYVAPSTTELVIQLDVWQTYGRNIRFGQCYVERGHIGIANEWNFDGYGRHYLNTLEGMDVGGEYDIVGRHTRKIASARDHDKPYSIMVVSTASLQVEGGTAKEPDPTVTGKGSQLHRLPSGAEYYLFDDLDHFSAFLDAFKDKSWVTQSIISITAVPAIAPPAVTLDTKTVNGVQLKRITAGNPKPTVTKLAPNWRDNVQLPTRYKHLKKFLTYPYMVLELTAYTGTPLVIKPESWNDKDASVVEIGHYALPSARLVFYPYRYNASTVPPEDAATGGLLHDGGEFLDMTTGIYNFPTFALVNNGYLQVMASQAHSIAYQHSAADWSQQKALTGNQLSHEQSTAGLGMQSQLTEMGINAATSQTNLSNQTAGYRAATGAVGGIASGIGNGPAGLMGGIGNAAMSGVNLAIDVNQSNQSLAISNQLARSTSGATGAHGQYVADTNKSFADYAAKGDYQSTIAALNAKNQDAKLTQPTTAGQMGGEAFNLAHYQWGYDLIVKMLQPSAMARVGESWLRYGYDVGRFLTPPENMKCMAKFTYWKMRETYIVSSACPESFKQAVRGIFEKGVTVWERPQDIGVVDIADNAPLTGITI